MRRSVLLLVALTAPALGACGESADSSSGEAETLAESVKQELREENREGGAFSQVLNLRCRPAGGAFVFGCDASVRARAFVFRDRYRVQLDQDGCWTAARTSLGVMRGSGLDAQELDSEGVLLGCLP